MTARLKVLRKKMSLGMKKITCNLPSTFNRMVDSPSLVTVTIYRKNVIKRFQNHKRFSSRQTN